MAYQKFDTRYRVLTPDELAPWREIPTAVASDCMNRTQVMSARIKPIFTGARVFGQARTAVTMAGDCGPICNLIGTARPGEILVIDAGGAENVAVWGGIMAEEAVHLGIGGAVVDGAIRDVSQMRELNFAMFCHSVVPRGPHHGFGGNTDATIAVGGVPVSPGDIVLGDDDGVAVVPLEMADQVLQAALAHLQREANLIDNIRTGRSMAGAFGVLASE
ncbi:MAG: RraA family protein [Janthinobacterium lividum]